MRLLFNNRFKRLSNNLLQLLLIRIQNHLTHQQLQILLVHLRVTVIIQLVLTLEPLLTNLTIELLFLLPLHLILPLRLILSPLLLIILLHLSQPLLLQQLLILLLQLFLSLLLFHPHLLLLLPLLLLLTKLHQVILVPRVPLLQVRDQILDGLDVELPLLLPLLLVLLLHLPPHPTIGGLFGVPLLFPDEGFVGGDVIPVLVKFQHLIQSGICHSEPFEHPHLLLGAILVLIGLLL